MLALVLNKGPAIGRGRYIYFMCGMHAARNKLSLPALARRQTVARGRRGPQPSLFL